MDDDAADGVMGAFIEAVTVQMAGAFDEIWSRPNAMQTMAAYLDGKIRFLIERGGVTILAEGDAPQDPPLPGMYL